MLEHIAVTYAVKLTSFSSTEMNSKIYAPIALIQVMAQKYLESTGIVERMRFRMKNEINMLYRYVLLN